MQQAPPLEALKEYLEASRPRGMRPPFDITDIDPKPISGHFNFLVESSDGQRMVLRLRGPEWGEPEGIAHEYRILEAVQDYHVAPLPVWFDSAGVRGEPASFIEYLDGWQPLSRFTFEEQRNKFAAVARLIAKINGIPQRLNMPFGPPRAPYAIHKRAWRDRLQEIEKDLRCRQWHEKIRLLLSDADRMLDEFEPLLARVIERSGEIFIFESAHIGHCLAHRGDLRFINWEKVSVGDPAYTLAVFLASIQHRPDFPEVKRMMIAEYLAARGSNIPEFSALVDQRLAERDVSNMIWVLFAYARRKDDRPPEEATSVASYYERVRQMLG